MQAKERMLSKNTDADLLLRKFKDEILKIRTLKVNVGIPKEYERHDFSSGKKAKKRDQIKDLIETERLLSETRKAIRRNDQMLPSFKPSLNNSEEKYIADIAWKNEKGSFAEHIPARPFGSTMIPRYKEKIKKVVKNEFKAYLEGKQDLTQVFNRIGLSGQKFMQDNLKNGNWKPNSPTTVRIKGSSKPLIDTGQMRQSITYIVEDIGKQ
jgi:hypothetical protein